MFLVVYAAVLILLFGVALGVVSSLRKGHTDTVILGATPWGRRSPSFVAAIVLISFFTLKLGWLPALGTGSGFGDS